MPLQSPPNPFLDKMARGEVAYGTFVFSRDPAVTEIVGSAGFDLAIIDTEHAVLGMPEVVDHMRAAQCAGISAWVRVGRYDPAEVGRILDSGAQGIVFPHYGLAPDQAAEGLSAMHYAPAGTRPTCTGIRGSAYGNSPFADYVQRSNQAVATIGLVEDAAVIERLDSVLDDPSLTAVMPGGVGDLASSLGLHGQARHPKVIAAARRVVDIAKSKRHLKVGVYLADLASMEDWRGMGIDFFIHSIDYKVLASALKGIRDALAHSD